MNDDPYEDLRVVRHQLATANGERYRLQATLNEFTTALAEWGNTYPDLGDPHDAHRRGYFNGDCAGCVAESKLLTIAQALADELDRAGQDNGAEASGELSHEQPDLELSTPADYAPASAPVQSPQHQP